VIDGLPADVVTLGLAYDIDELSSKAGLIPADRQKRLPHNSSPYTSTIVFLVRKGNPKGFKDWDDLVKPGVQVITPNPKTSGGARRNYLAAWGYALKKNGGSDAKAREFVVALSVSQAYLEYLYSPAGQKIIAENFYRPVDPGVAAQYATKFPQIALFRIDDVFGGWTEAQTTHFNDGGVFDQIFVKQ